MEDKTFELLEKMYIEMQEMKHNIIGIEGKVVGIEGKVIGIEGKMVGIEEKMIGIEGKMATKQDLVRIENKMDVNDKALYDGYRQSMEGITKINEKLDKLTDRVENQEIKLQVLRSVK